MPKRRTGQCKDIVIGGYKKLFYNDTGNISDKVRLAAGDRMMMIDGFYPEELKAQRLPQADSGQLSSALTPTEISAADKLLEEMRSKQGGTSANTPS
jgi:hypothetical protein